MVVDDSNELNVAASIQTATGWLNLQDPDTGYELDATALVDHAVTHRKVEVSSGWMEGTFISRSVRENITETVAVQVIADTPDNLAIKLKALTDAFEQIGYQIVVSFGTSQEIWQCTVADYTTSTTREYRFATMAVVKAQVPHLPSAYVRAIPPDTPPGEPGFWILDDPVKSVLGATTVLI